MIENYFKEVTVDKIVSSSERPLLFVFSPNYEDRSISFPIKLNKMNKKRKLLNFALCFMNDNNNDSVLEGLKAENLNTISSNIGLSNDSCEWLQYPQGVSENAIKSIILERTLEFSEEFDILIDVSAIPRTIIYYICESILFVKNRGKNRLKSILFAYTSPLKYSKVMYAQDIGLLYGFFSGRALRANCFDEIHTIIFPSRSGHEGKLLLDDVRQIRCGEQLHTMYFPIDSDNYLESMELMKANQILMSHNDYMQRYYCTIEDACIDLHKLINDEIAKINTQKQRVINNDKRTSLYLVAPFGKKIFLPVAFFELKYMKHELGDDVDIEICHAKGFQYTSVYSLGVGTTEIFSLENYTCD